MPKPSGPAARARGTGERNRTHSPRITAALDKLRELGLVDKRVTYGKRQAQRLVKSLEGVVSGDLKPVRVTDRTAAALKGHVAVPTRARGVRKGVVLVDAEARVVTRRGGKGGGATTSIVRDHGTITPIDWGIARGGPLYSPVDDVEQAAADLFKQLRPGDVVGFSLDTPAPPGVQSGHVPYTSRRLFNNPQDLARYLRAYTDVRNGTIGGVVVFGVGKDRAPTYLAGAKQRADAAKASATARRKLRRKARNANGRPGR